MFKSSWADFEENHSVIIWEQNGSYFIKKYGYSVMIGDYKEKRKISSSEALEIMFEQLENEDDDYLAVNYSDN